MFLEIINLSILLGVSYLTARVSMWLKIPAGRLIGPILTIGFLKIMGLEIIAPKSLVMICSIILGVYIGLQFNKRTLKRLKLVVIPGALQVVWGILITFIYGYILLKISSLDKATAFLSVVPGGIAEVSVLALSYHADISQITSFQLARLLTIVLIVPVLVKRVFVYHDEHYYEERVIENIETENEEIISSDGKNDWWLFFVIGGIGSIIFTLLHFPAGRMVGALAFTSAYNFSPYKKVSIPPVKYYNWGQIGMGGIIGTSFTRESFFTLPDLFYPILIITCLILFNSLILAWIFSKIFKWDFLTSFLGIIPGGLAPMVLIADQVNADVVIVSSLQLLRVLTAVVVLPFLYIFFL